MLGSFEVKKGREKVSISFLIFFAFQIRCVPAFVCAQLSVAVAGTAAGTTERHMALALALYGLAFQHRALLAAVVRGLLVNLGSLVFVFLSFCFFYSVV